MAACSEDESRPPREARHVGEYDSAFEYDSEHEKKEAKRKDLAVKGERTTHTSRAKKHVFTEEYTKNAGIAQSFHRTGVDAYARHKQLINDYFLYYKGSTSILRRDTSNDRTDLDVIRENHKFLWSDDDDAESTWGRRIAKKYYDKLFKEYCIADLSRYKENRVAMRWRVEKEVVDGKGQFMCGNKECVEKEELKTWEVNFAYLEDGEKKNALVKLRLCDDCSNKLNYRHKRKEVTKAKKRSSVSEKDTELPEKSSKTDELTSETDATKDKSAEIDPNQVRKLPSKSLEKTRDKEFDAYFNDLFL